MMRGSYNLLKVPRGDLEALAHQTAKDGGHRSHSRRRQRWGFWCLDRYVAQWLRASRN